MMVDESWHLRKEVSIGTLAAILLQLVVLAAMFVRMDSRISKIETENVTNARMAVVEHHLVANDRLTERLEARTLKSLDEIHGALRRIEDRIESRQGQRQ